MQFVHYQVENLWAMIIIIIIIVHIQLFPSWWNEKSFVCTCGCNITFSQSGICSPNVFLVFLCFYHPSTSFYILIFCLSVLSKTFWSITLIKFLTQLYLLNKFAKFNYFFIKCLNKLPKRGKVLHKTMTWHTINSEDSNG